MLQYSSTSALIRLQSQTQRQKVPKQDANEHHHVLSSAHNSYLCNCAPRNQCEEEQQSENMNTNLVLWQLMKQGTNAFPFDCMTAKRIRERVRGADE